MIIRCCIKWREWYVLFQVRIDSLLSPKIQKLNSIPNGIGQVEDGIIGLLILSSWSAPDASSSSLVQILTMGFPYEESYCVERRVTVLLYTKYLIANGRMASIHPCWSFWDWGLGSRSRKAWNAVRTLMKYLYVDCPAKYLASSAPDDDIWNGWISGESKPLSEEATPLEEETRLVESPSVRRSSYLRLSGLMI